MDVSFDTPGVLGDWLCMVSASREYARRHPEARVFLPNLRNVLDAFGDGLVEYGRCADHRVIRAEHREKYLSTRHNYVGTFLRELCPEINQPKNLELPKLFSSGQRLAVIQPYSGHAANPPREYVQSLADAIVRFTGQKLFAVGHTSTPRDLRGVDYSLIADDVIAFLSHIANADFVLTPRSAAAHVASGYGVPTFVWVPDDGENWHLNYPGWWHRRHYHRYGVQDAIQTLRLWLDDLRGAEGTAQNPGPTARALSEDYLFGCDRDRPRPVWPRHTIASFRLLCGGLRGMSQSNAARWQAIYNNVAKCIIDGDVLVAEGPNGCIGQIAAHAAVGRRVFHFQEIGQKLTDGSCTDTRDTSARIALPAPNRLIECQGATPWDSAEFASCRGLAVGHLSLSSPEFTIAALHHFWPMVIDGGAMSITDWQQPFVPWLERIVEHFFCKVQDVKLIRDSPRQFTAVKDSISRI